MRFTKPFAFLAVLAFAVMPPTITFAQGNDASQCVDKVDNSDGESRFYNHCTSDININISDDKGYDSGIFTMQPNPSHDPAGYHVPLGGDGQNHDYKWAACMAPQRPGVGSDNHKPSYNESNYHCQ